MVLGHVFPKETIVTHLSSTEKDELFEELVETAYSYKPEFDRNEVLRLLNEREAKMSTGIMHSIGIPHALISSFHGSVGVIGISREGIDYDSLDKAPVHVVFMILGAESETERHIQILKQLDSVLHIPNFVGKLLACTAASEVYDFLCASEASILE